MLTRIRADAATAIAGPIELLPGCPYAIIDLQTDAGVELVQGQWRYADARVEQIEFVEVGHPDDPLGPGVVPNSTYDVVPHAQRAVYDDCDWRALEPADTQLRLSQGRVCFNWYRIAVTIPERIGDLDPTGASIVFEVAIDDYAEVWVDGQLPHALGDAGGPVVGGFNAPNRVLLTDDARPGRRFQIAVFGINGPITIPSTISSTIAGSRIRGKKPSTNGASTPAATTISRLVKCTVVMSGSRSQSPSVTRPAPRHIAADAVHQEQAVVGPTGSLRPRSCCSVVKANTSAPRKLAHGDGQSGERQRAERLSGPGGQARPQPGSGQAPRHAGPSAQTWRSGQAGDDRARRALTGMRERKVGRTGKRRVEHLCHRCGPQV